MLHLDGRNLSITQVVKAVRDGTSVAMAAESLPGIEASRLFVEELVAKDAPVYGISTGVGKLADTKISSASVQQLQRNLILSHSCGVGEPLPAEIVKAMMLIRANTLMRGYSGVRASLIQMLIDMLNTGVVPLVPHQGSVGASGDLIPLAHIAAVMIGEGYAYVDERCLPGAQALHAVGLNPVVLQAKEGLALINGTQYMTAYGVMAVYDGQVAAKSADIASAVTMEALDGIPDAFDERVQQLRPHKGQITTASNLRRILQGSGRVHRSHRERVQDAYSLRCVPQVHGATRDALAVAWQVMAVELNSVTDNPLILWDDQEVLSAGNFHGQPLALPLDYLGIALAELASISQYRIERLVNPTLSGLPAFLVEGGGLHSGFMITQYNAAALVSENKVLAHPASVDSIPTSADQEDHVSMGSIAARKCVSILSNLQNVLAVELLCGCQALEFVDRQKLSPAVKAVYGRVRAEIPPLTEDRILAGDIQTMCQLLRSGTILHAVETVVGPLE